MLMPKTEKELKTTARRLSWKIWTRNDAFIQLPDDESETMYKIVYGALLTLNSGSGKINADQEDTRQAILDVAEYTFDLFFPHANGYLSIYRPLEYVIETWEEIKEEE